MNLPNHTRAAMNLPNHNLHLPSGTVHSYEKWLLSRCVLFNYQCLVLGLAKSECPSDWIIREDYCYHYHHITSATNGMGWSDSRLACKRYGGDLVVIRNQDEQKFLIANMIQSQKRQHYWIGLSCQASEGKKFRG